MPPYEKMDMIQQAALGQHGFIVFAQAKAIDVHCSDNSFWNGIVHRPNPCRASFFCSQTSEDFSFSRSAFASGWIATKQIIARTSCEARRTLLRHPRPCRDGKNRSRPVFCKPYHSDRTPWTNKTLPRNSRFFLSILRSFVLLCVLNAHNYATISDTPQQQQKANGHLPFAKGAVCFWNSGTILLP